SRVRRNRCATVETIQCLSLHVCIVTQTVARASHPWSCYTGGTPVPRGRLNNYSKPIHRIEVTNRMSPTVPENNNTINTELDQLCINTIRTLSIDAVQQAQSGHPGLPLGAAPMAYVLWTRFLHHNPRNPKWENRDRFLLSAGHGSMLLYSLLHLT